MHVVYMVKPMNLASLKFSGRLRVLMAYKVHMTIRKMSKPRGTRIPNVVALQVNCEQRTSGETTQSTHVHAT